MWFAVAVRLWKKYYENKVVLIDNDLQVDLDLRMYFQSIRINCIRALSMTNRNRSWNAGIQWNENHVFCRDIQPYSV